MKNSSLFSKISLIQLSILFCFVTPPNALSKNKNPDPNQNLHQINKIYKGLHKGYSHKIKKQKEFFNQTSAATYGEITYEGGKQLLKHLSLHRNDVFYDLGSGIGRFVIQTYLESPAKKVVGIELSKLRAKQAKKAFDRMKKNGLLKKNK